jgi:hypothetical protein
LYTQNGILIIPYNIAVLIKQLYNVASAVLNIEVSHVTVLVDGTCGRSFGRTPGTALRLGQSKSLHVHDFSLDEMDAMQCLCGCGTLSVCLKDKFAAVVIIILSLKNHDLYNYISFEMR